METYIKFGDSTSLPNEKREKQMSEKMKAIIGEELYAQVKEKMGKESFGEYDGFVPRARLNEQIDKLKATEEKIVSYEKQMVDTKNLIKDSEEFKVKFADMETKFKGDLEGKDKEITNILKKSLVKESLVAAGAKHPDLLMKQVSMDAMTLDNGKLLGMADTMESLKKEYSDLFVAKVNKQDIDKNKGNKNEDKFNQNDDDTDWGEVVKTILI